MHIWEIELQISSFHIKKKYKEYGDDFLASWLWRVKIVLLWKYALDDFLQESNYYSRR